MYAKNRRLIDFYSHMFIYLISLLFIFPLGICPAIFLCYYIFIENKSKKNLTKISHFRYHFSFIIHKAIIICFCSILRLREIFIDQESWRDGILSHHLKYFVRGIKLIKKKKRASKQLTKKNIIIMRLHCNESYVTLNIFTQIISHEQQHFILYWKSKISEKKNCTKLYNRIVPTVKKCFSFFFCRNRQNAFIEFFIEVIFVRCFFYSNRAQNKINIMANVDFKYSHLKLKMGA